MNASGQMIPHVLFITLRSGPSDSIVKIGVDQSGSVKVIVEVDSDTTPSIVQGVCTGYIS
jgi:hypothetical protein